MLIGSVQKWCSNFLVILMLSDMLNMVQIFIWHHLWMPSNFILRTKVQRINFSPKNQKNSIPYSYFLVKSAQNNFQPTATSLHIKRSILVFEIMSVLYAIRPSLHHQTCLDIYQLILDWKISFVIFAIRHLLGEILTSLLTYLIL